MAHDAADTQRSARSLHAKHILGFQDMSNNANGDLTIQAGYLRFQKTESALAEIPVGSIQNVVLGVQDRQVGGIPMILAKSATPYGGGRAISLFSHKKYDTVTLEFVDRDGGFHGAIFELDKGTGQVLRSQLEDAGVHITRVEDETAKVTTQETKNEVK